MNTLKLKLVGACLFAAAAAHGQQLTPYSLGTAPGASPFAAQYQSRSAAFASDSYVLQYGYSQYANVNQTGSGNTADIIQDIDNDMEHDNNAYQVQTHVGTAGRNKAWIGQDGNYSTAFQLQYGGGNTANIDQGPNDSNADFAFQYQVGDNNRAGVTQTSDGDVAVQEQFGNKNYATTAQSNLNGWSTIVQVGDMHTAIVVQH